MQRVWNKTNLVRLVCAVLLFIVSYSAVYLWHAMPVATGFSAKMMCSQVFLANRHPESVTRNELAKFPLYFTSVKIDPQTQTAEASILGFASQNAVFREGFGCALANQKSDLYFMGQSFSLKPRKQMETRELAWPMGEAVEAPPEGVDTIRLMGAIQEVFEPNGTDPYVLKKSSAVVVVYDGKIIAEKYAPGITPQTRHISWSIAKSLTNAMLGVVVKHKKLDVHWPVPIPQWQDDDRKHITIANLLRMDTGLHWMESYGGLSSVNTMIFKEADMGHYAMQFPLNEKPGETFKYSSGTTAILSSVIREAVGDGSYHDFAYEELFDKIGMHSLVMEVDESGTFVGSSYAFATARDYARFGLLYYQDGMWNGERILPEGWVTFSTTPSQSSQGRYGAKFWLNAGGNQKHPSGYNFPSLPRDTYAAIGLGGQYILVIPSKKLIVVRLAHEIDELRRDGDQNMLGMDTFVRNIIATLPS